MKEATKPQNHQSNNNKIAIIAGEGELPKYIYQSSINNSKDAFIVFFDHLNYKNWDKKVIEGKNAEFFNIAKIGKIIKFLENNNITNIIFAGSLQRPKWFNLRPDIKGISLLNKIRVEISKKNKHEISPDGINHFSVKGDNYLLTTIISFLEDHKFKVISIADIAPEILAEKGTLTNGVLTKEDFEDITLGFRFIADMSKYDVGQSIIIEDGVFLGIEAIEGTDNLIKRVKGQSRTKNGPILVKGLKEKQDTRIDLPTIGPETIHNIHNSGIRGIAIAADYTVIIDYENTINLANEMGVFVVGVEIE